MGLGPFGSLLFGWLATIIGAPYTLMAGGLCCIAGGVFFAGKFKSVESLVHKAFINKGLISE